MAIGLGGFKRFGEQQAASKRLAAEYASQQRRSKKRGFFSKILGGVGGKILGAGITGLLGLTGIGAPIGLALGNMLAKKGAHEMTKSMAADPSQIKATGKYGYGEGEAKTLREGLEEQVRESDPFKQQGGFGKELLSSFVSAGASGALKGTLKDFGKGSFIKEGQGVLGGGENPLKDAFKSMGGKFEDVVTWGGDKEDVTADVGDASKKVYSPLHSAPDVTQGDEYQGLLFEQESPMLGPELEAEQGGLVPEYKNGGTIANYFGKQGVSLGGSFKHSFAEMLGKR